MASFADDFDFLIEINIALVQLRLHDFYDAIMGFPQSFVWISMNASFVILNI